MKTAQERRRIANALEWSALVSGTVLAWVIYNKTPSTSAIFIIPLWVFILTYGFSLSMIMPSILVIVMPWYRAWYKTIEKPLTPFTWASSIRLLLILGLFATVAVLGVATNAI